MRGKNLLKIETLWMQTASFAKSNRIIIVIKKYNFTINFFLLKVKSAILFKPYVFIYRYIKTTIVGK